MYKGVCRLASHDSFKITVSCLKIQIICVCYDLNFQTTTAAAAAGTTSSLMDDMKAKFMLH